MVAYYNEFDEKAAAWLRELIARGLIADGVVDTRSIEDVEPRQLAGFTQCHFFAGIGVWSYALRQAGWPDDRPVWTMSCPCQPFSAAGKGGGFDDERHLWPSAQWLIEQRRPRVVFGEQVASKDAEPWLDLVQVDVEAMDYAFGACAFPSAGVGAPHIRDRSYWVAESGGGRRDGRTAPTRSETWAVAGVADLGGAGGLADDDDARLEGRRQSGRERGTERAAGPGGLAGGLADDTLGGRREKRADVGGQPIRDSEEGFAPGPEHGERAGGVGRHADTHGAGAQGEHGLREVAAHAGPVNGFWRNADWIYCRNGEWRPVEGRSFPLSNGAPARMVTVCACCKTETRWLNGQTAETHTAQVLQVLRGADGAQKAAPRRDRNAEFVQPESVLQLTLLWSSTSEGTIDTGGSVHASATTLPEGFMQSVRVVRAVTGTPSRSEPFQQPGEQSRGFVRAVSREGASETDEDVYLRDLRRLVSGSQSPQPAQDLFCPVCQGVRAHKCAQEMVSRVAELRGYGNAINAQAAKVFIESYLEARS